MAKSSLMTSPLILYLCLSFLWSIDLAVGSQAGHERNVHPPPDTHRHNHKTHGQRRFDFRSLAVGTCDWDFLVNRDFGRNDIANLSAPSSKGGPGLCCDHCDRTHGCTHWTWQGGICWLKASERPEFAPLVACTAGRQDTRDVWPVSLSTTCASGFASSFPTKTTLKNSTLDGKQSNRTPGNDLADDFSPAEHPKLFCFVVARPTRNDHDLLRLQVAKVLRECDSFAVYSNTSDTPFGSIPFPGAEHIQVPKGVEGRTMDVPYGPYLNALNTPTFLPIFKHAFQHVASANAARKVECSSTSSRKDHEKWSEPLADGAAYSARRGRSPLLGRCGAAYAFDWVVKVDVDTVVAVDRLRRVLRDHNPRTPQVLCNKPMFRGPQALGHPTCLDGPLEVVSAAGAELYAAKGESECEAKLVNSQSPAGANFHLPPNLPNSSSVTFDVGRMGEDWYLDACFAEALLSPLPQTGSRTAVSRSQRLEHAETSGRHASRVIESRLLVNSYPLWPLQAGASKAKVQEWETKNDKLKKQQALRNLEWCRGPHARGSKAALHPVKDPSAFKKCLGFLLS